MINVQNQVEVLPATSMGGGMTKKKAVCRIRGCSTIGIVQNDLWAL